MCGNLRGKSVVVRAKETSQSFDPAAFARLFELEGKHYWFRARNQVIGEVMKRYKVAAGQNISVLELGCGNGNALSYLSRTLGIEKIWGADLFAEALRHCQERARLPVIQLDAHALPFESSLDVVCMFDVLEHLQADMDILAEVYRVLKPGGRVVLTVPAYQRLWSYFDEISHHRRRYGKAQLCHGLEAMGFSVEMCSYYMMGLLPLMIVGRRLQSRRHSDIDEMAEADLRVIPIVNELLYLMCSAEKWLVSRVGLPFGASIIAVGCRD